MKIRDIFKLKNQNKQYRRRQAPRAIWKQIAQMSAKNVKYSWEIGG